MPAEVGGSPGQSAGSGVTAEPLLASGETAAGLMELSAVAVEASTKVESERLTPHGPYPGDQESLRGPILNYRTPPGRRHLPPLERMVATGHLTTWCE